MSCDCGCSCNCSTVIQKGDIGPQGPQGIQGIQGEQGEQGDQGEPGENGRTILSGITAPSIGLGDIGDFYINTATDEIYGPKSGGGWGSPTSLIGPQGPPGPSGAGYEYEIGEYVSAEGGVVFFRWLSTTPYGVPENGTVQNYLIVSLEDVSSSEIWINVALDSTYISGATSNWDGESNTSAIMTAGATNGAAYDCSNFTGGGKSDWYLPAIDEMWKLYNNRWEVNRGLASVSPTPYDLIGYKVGYWTSNNDSNDATIAYQFYTGPSSSLGNPTFQQLLKSDLYDVRAVRKFTYTP